MDTKLAVERLQYRKLLLCCRVGNRRDGFRNRNDLLLLFAAAKKAVETLGGNCTGAVLGFNRTISLNPAVKSASGNRVLLADLSNRLYRLTNVRFCSWLCCIVISFHILSFTAH